MCLLVVDIIKLEDSKFLNTPRENCDESEIYASF
jgi:hypothetical protein